jgi:hypothetical protein
MSIVTYEGIVENGQIRLDGNVRLPEHARVYVLLPDATHVPLPPVAHIASPRLVDPQDATRFSMEIVEEPADADV